MGEAEQPFEYQITALSFRTPGSVQYFSENLPAEAVGIPSGLTGQYEWYLAILDFYRRTGLDPLDPIAFKSWLETETELYASLGGDIGVQAFIDLCQHLALSTAEAVTGVLKDRWNTRKQLNAIEELKRVVGSKEIKTQEDLDNLTKLTEQIRILSSSIQYDPYDRIEIGADLAARADGIWDLPDFIPSPYNDLNVALGYTTDGGFCMGAVHAIIAQSGLGKSTLAKCLMNYWVNGDENLNRAPRKVLFVNYEEAIAHWERVLFTQITRHNVYKGGTASEKERFGKLYQDTLNRWGDNFMVRHDPDTPYFDDLERWLYDLAAFSGGPPDVIIIDTIQSMFMKGSGGKPRWGQFEEMMVRLEKLAKDTHSAVIITAQENSNRMKERREEVQQSDAGGSLTIIQKAAVSIFITRKKIASGDDSEDERVMELQIPKNRITGGAFSKRPPMVYYNDEIKSYESFDIDIASDKPEEYTNWKI